jgi:7,8-dihydroneopterin aldolase/epimerase/oxygenase
MIIYYLLSRVHYYLHMDCIHLTGIRSYGYTGYLPEEQVLGQWFEVDVKLWLDLSKSGETDAIEDTVDYRSIIGLVQNTIKTSKFALVERLTAYIADSILALSDRVTQVQVILSKPAAPIPDFGGKISIDMIKKR